MGKLDGFKNEVLAAGAALSTLAAFHEAKAATPDTIIEAGASITHQVNKDIAVKAGFLFVEKIPGHEATEANSGEKGIVSFGVDLPELAPRLTLSPHLDIHIDQENVSMIGGGADVVVEAVRHFLFVVLRDKFSEGGVEASGLIEFELPGHVSVGPAVLVESHHYHGAEVLYGGEIAYVAEWTGGNVKIALEGLGNGHHALAGLRVGISLGEEGEVKPQMALEP